MQTLNRAELKRQCYVFSGIIAVTSSSLASFSIALGLVLAIAIALNYLKALFLPALIFTFIMVWTIAFALFLHYEIMRRMVLAARRIVIKSLRLKRGDLIQLRRIDPFRKIVFWGYIFPFLAFSWFLSLAAIGIKFS